MHVCVVCVCVSARRGASLREEGLKVIVIIVAHCRRLSALVARVDEPSPFESNFAHLQRSSATRRQLSALSKAVITPDVILKNRSTHTHQQRQLLPTRSNRQATKKTAADIDKGLRLSTGTEKNTLETLQTLQTLPLNWGSKVPPQKAHRIIGWPR